jgi:hypothetical protein
MQPHLNLSDKYLHRNIALSSIMGPLSQLAVCIESVSWKRRVLVICFSDRKREFTLIETWTFS